MLCDGCDQGYHQDCCTPPLASVPADTWFCHNCSKVLSPDQGATKQDASTAPKRGQPACEDPEPPRKLAKNGKGNKGTKGSKGSKSSKIAVNDSDFGPEDNGDDDDDDSDFEVITSRHFKPQGPKSQEQTLKAPTGSKPKGGAKARNTSREKRAKKDPNAPKGARSAYILFGIDRRPGLVADNPGEAGCCRAGS